MSDSDDPRDEKKRRIQRACDACRRKKIKCDGPQSNDNVCTNCKTLGYQCTYVEQAKKRGPPKGYVESIENRLARMENLISRIAPGADFSAELGARIDKDTFDLSVHRQFEPVGSGVTGTSLSSAGGSSSRRTSGRSPPHACAGGEVVRPWLESDTGQEDEEEKALYTAMSKIQLGTLGEANEDVNIGFAGKSSSFGLLMSAREYKYGSAGAPDQFEVDLVSSRRPFFWKSPLWENSKFIQQHRQPWPPADLAPVLVDLFFRTLHQFIPLLHEPTFRRHFNDRLYDRDREFHQLCLVVFACGAKHCDDPRIWLPAHLLPASMPDKYRKYSAGWPLIGQIMSEQFDWNALPTLFELQKMALFISFLTGSSHPRISWTVIGVAIRNLIDLGIHREHVVKAMPKAEGEQWRRVFWVLYGVDRSTAAIMGRPLTLHDEDIDLEYPLDVDDEYWETADPALAFRQPPGKPSRLAGFIAMLKLHQIAGYCLRTVYCINKAKLVLKFTTVEAQQQVVAELDSALNAWLDQIPAHLKWDPHNPDEIFMQQSAQLYATYYTTQIFVHRPFIPSSTRPTKFAFPSLAICSNAARSGAHVVETARHRPLSQGLEALLAIQGWTFSIVLLINIWGNKRLGAGAEPATARADIDKMARFFSKLEERWLMAGKLADVLRELSNQGDLPRQETDSAPPSQKRSRDATASTVDTATPGGAKASASRSSPSHNGVVPARTASNGKKSASADFTQPPFTSSAQHSPAPIGVDSPAPSNASSASLLVDSALDADILQGRHLPTQPQFTGFPPFAGGSTADGGAAGAAPNAGVQVDPAQLAQFYAFINQGSQLNTFNPSAFGLQQQQQQRQQQQPLPPSAPAAPQEQQQQEQQPFVPPDWMLEAIPGIWPTPSASSPAAVAAPATPLDNANPLLSSSSLPIFSPTADGASSFFAGDATFAGGGDARRMGDFAGAPPPGAQASIGGLWEHAPASFQYEDWETYLSQFNTAEGKQER